MKILLILIGLILTNQASAQLLEKDNVNKELCSCWHVLDYVHTEGEALSKEEIRSILSKKLCINKNMAIMFSDTLRNPHYSIEKYLTSKFLWENFQVTPKAFNIKSDSLCEIIVDYKILSKRDGKLHPSSLSMMYDGTYLFVFRDGVLFRLANKYLKAPSRLSGH